MGRPKEKQIGDMHYINFGFDLGECGAPGCGKKAFSYNENGDLFCEECLEEWHESKELGQDDPNCCQECGGDLDKTGFCWECDF